ncbi:MAG: NADPH-dependent 7-cyano-7-deazaguanine reductase QueF [Idiomarina sp.]|nr:NADPH-dependent 7-cyano-7-deazaguanine reductase QueF [Idiomarina sp.]
MAELGLGKATTYPEQFDASLLQPVPRQINRTPIGVDDNALPFYGIDTWTCYELSWLTPSGLPAVAIAEVDVPVTSPNLIESKSFKLYLNGYNQTVFESWDAVMQQLTADLSACAGAPVTIRLFTLREFTGRGVQLPPGESIDQEDIQITEYGYNPKLLVADPNQVVTETLHSDLLKSNCLITNQPDWGSVIIRYTGPKINRGALLRYLVSFRTHNEFHEQCVERIFMDLCKMANCRQLEVQARYTRRGGLDINPWRGNTGEIQLAARTARQ